VSQFHVVAITNFFEVLIYFCFHLSVPLHLLVHCPNGQNSQSWVKLGAWNSIRVSHLGGRDSGARRACLAGSGWEAEEQGLFRAFQYGIWAPQGEAQPLCQMPASLLGKVCG